MLQRQWLQATQSYCGATLPRMLRISRRSKILLGKKIRGFRSKKGGREYASKPF